MNAESGRFALVCYPDRLLFRAGNYPDKSFSMTDEELVEAAGKDPVPIDLGHPSAPSPLDGHLGHVSSRRVVFDEAGQAVLRGDVYLPEWMEDKLPKDQSCLSCTFRISDKKLQSISLVTEPRVRDAVLLAYTEFASRHDTPEGQGALQAIHDHAARNGARCSAGNTEMHSGHEVSAIQKIHDTAVEHGATCRKMGADNRSAMYSRGSGRGGIMSFMDKLANFFRQEGIPVPGIDPRGDTPAGGESGGGGGTAEMTGTADDPRVAALQQQLQAQASALASLQAERTRAEAVAFAERQVRDGRAVPAEQEGLAAIFCQLSAVPGEVTFSQNGQAKKGTLLQQWQASIETRPVIQFTTEKLEGGTPTVLFAGGPAPTAMQTTPADEAGTLTEPMTPERRAYLNSLTPAGRALNTEEQKRAREAATLGALLKANGMIAGKGG